ncbi:MAG: sugar transferase [Chloroflexota bacterium]
MKAVILATNTSQNLRPLTDSLPDPLVPLVGRPIIVYTLELLARSGIHDVIVCLHNNAGNIEATLGTGRRWGLSLEYSLHRDSLGDAGAIGWARGSLDQPFLLIPGNGLFDLNVEKIQDSHLESGAHVTILDHKSGHTGCYIFNPEVVALIPQREAFDIQTQLIPKVQQEGLTINHYLHDGYFNRVCSFQALQDAQQLYMQSAVGDTKQEQTFKIRFPSILGNRFGDSVWAGKNNLIHPTVRIFPPVVIGDNCQIGKDVELGPFTVIGSNSIIDDEASVQNSVVTEKTYIGKLVNVEDKLVTRSLMIDFPTSQSTYITDSFLIGEAGPPSVNNGFRFLIDRVVASILIVIFLPVLFTIGLCSFLGTGRIFNQVGRIGVPPYKALYENSFSPSQLSLKHFSVHKKDGSLSPITGWIYRSGLYRLSELISVLQGKLSLIGVKPLSPEEAGQISEDWQHQRYGFSAGFTGLWYTEQDNDSLWESTIIYDVYYVAMRNLSEDFRILLKTPARWVKNHLFS